MTRRIAIIAGGIIAGVLGGWMIAQGSMALLAMAAAVLLLWIGGRTTGVRPDAFVGGLALIGYLAANRGFAQLQIPGVPLLPAEAVLGVGLVIVSWNAIRNKELPFRRDFLNAAILAWMAVGSARIYADFQAHGFMAVRDFAMVYYAAFFFLAQAWGDLPVERRWVARCLTVGFLLAAPVFYLFRTWPEWMITHTTIAGIPLIFVKSDVAGGFMAAAAVWFLHRGTAGRLNAWIIPGAGCLVGVAFSNSRAAMVALATGIVWLLLLRSWRILGVIGAVAALGLLALGGQAVTSRRPLPDTPLYRLYETVRSIGDVGGEGNYQAEQVGDKPDNNQFRRVWWQAVADETLAEGPWFGLGYGYDLARDFVRIYYADAPDDFSARSPHNFFLTVFGRNGAVGLVALLAIAGVLVRRIWKAGTESDERTPYWLAAWIILVNACFGVVLEGPMGAVVFWTVLGLANAGAERPLEAPGARHEAGGFADEPEKSPSETLSPHASRLPPPVSGTPPPSPR